MWASLANYFGVYDPLVYARLGPERRQLGWRAAYSLLDVGEDPTAAQISIFEDVCYKLRMTNGSYKLTFRNRFEDVNAVVLDVLRERYPADAALAVEDRAVSNALTSVEWALNLFAQFPQASVTASDLVLHLVEFALPDGCRYIAEPGGAVLQCIAPPWVLSVHHREAFRKPVHQLMAARYRRKLASGGLVSTNTAGEWMSSPVARNGTARDLSLVHPEARKLAREDARFSVVAKSIFEPSLKPVHVVRTMNVLNRGYFAEVQLRQGVMAAHQSLNPGGIWIVGRTLEEDSRNHASIFLRGDSGWQLLTRVGKGSEIDDLAMEWNAVGGR